MDRDDHKKRSDIAYNVAVVKMEQGRIEEAFEYYNVAIEADPSNFQALNNLGALCKETGQVEKAITYYKQAINVDAGFRIGYKNISVAYNDLGSQCFSQDKNVEQAIFYFKKALKYNIDLNDAYYNLGVVYSSKGSREEAIRYYKYCVEVCPDYINAHNNLGAVHKELNQFIEAENCYLSALEIDPNFPAANNNIAVIYSMQGRVREATTHLETAIRVNPEYGTAFNMMGSIKRDIMKSAEAIGFFMKAAELEPFERGPMDNMLLVMNDIYGLDEELIFKTHDDWGKSFSQRYEQLPDPQTSLDVNKILKVGYVSADMSTHSVAYFSEVFLRDMDPQQVQLFIYSNSPVIDHTTRRLMSYPNLTWRQIEVLSSVEAASLIRKDEIDILIDLAGHTGGNRLDIFAHKPAPVQITCVGYPNTTGLPQIDYRITDEFVDPANTSQKFSENLIRISGGTFLCYIPTSPHPEISKIAPVSVNHYITFGSFNNAAKMNDQVFNLWVQVLLAVPNSRLLLKCKAFASAEVKSELHAKIQALGVDESRVILMGHKGEVKEHLLLYNSIDIALDTFPYAGTTTTVEAMFMGVPVVTLKGKSHSQNVGVSLLNSVGPLVSDLIAENEDHFVEIAVKLAQNEKRIGDIHAHLRDHLLASRLCDTSKYIKNTMALYRDVWNVYCDSRSKNRISS
jgi:predicted O-linked N-acetylglucosamine transferase (SPINDLY family)